jgi:hypothetical protein
MAPHTGGVATPYEPTVSQHGVSRRLGGISTLRLRSATAFRRGDELSTLVRVNGARQRP